MRVDSIDKRLQKAFDKFPFYHTLDEMEKNLQEGKLCFYYVRHGFSDKGSGYILKIRKSEQRIRMGITKLYVTCPYYIIVNLDNEELPYKFGERGCLLILDRDIMREGEFKAFVLPNILCKMVEKEYESQIKKR